MFKLKDLKKELIEKKTLKSEDVETLLALREEEKELAVKLEAAKSFREQKEMEIYTALKAGANTSRLPWLISIERIYRVYPAWKALFIQELGEKRATALADETPKTGYIDVVVEKK